MNFCPRCGSSVATEARFCSLCGFDLATAVAPATEHAETTDRARDSTPTPEPAPTARATSASTASTQLAWQRQLPHPFDVIPLELLVICGLMALAGGLTLWPVLRVLPNLFQLIGDGGFTTDLGLLLLTVWAVLGLFGVACIVLAWRLAHADRVARGLTYVLLGGLGASILFGDFHDWQLTLVMLSSFLAVAVLGFAARVQAYFTGTDARQHDAPTSVVTARTLVAVWASATTVIGVMFLPLSDIGERYVVVGVFFLALGIGGFFANPRLAAAEPLARLLVTTGAAMYVALLLVLDRRDPGLILPLTMGVGVVFFLWGPTDARTFFAEGSLTHPLPAWLRTLTSPAPRATLPPRLAAEPVAAPLTETAQPPIAAAARVEGLERPLGASNVDIENPQAPPGSDQTIDVPSEPTSGVEPRTESASARSTAGGSVVGMSPSRQSPSSQEAGACSSSPPGFSGSG